MIQEISMYLFAIFELIRKPRKRSSDNSMIGLPAGVGILVICYGLLKITPSAFTDGQYGVAISFVLIVIALIYFNFDLINIKEVLHYKSTDYYKLTKIPFSEILNDKGVRGEFYSYLLFKHVKGYCKMLFNTYVPMPNGSFQEIDSIAICERGIFVIESKNRTGFFEGEAEGKVWNQYLGSKINEMQNPVEQNQKHKIALDYYLKTNEKILNNCETSPYSFILISFIFFAEGADVNISGKLPMNTLVSNRRGAYEYIKYVLNNSNDIEFKPNDIDRIYNELLPLSTYSEQEKKEKMQYRERMAEMGKFKRHEYKYYDYIGASGLDDFKHWKNENGNFIRYDGVYHEFYIEEHNMWVAIPNLDLEVVDEIS